MRRPDVPAPVLEALAAAMARDPRDRFPSALAFAQALRDVQHALGFPPTPLEVAVEEWVPGDRSVDFADAATRGPQISSVPHSSRRRASAPVPLTARDEDTDISAPQTAPPRRVWPWLVVGAVVVVAAVLVVWALVTGGAG